MPLYFAYGSCMSLTDLLRTEPNAVFVSPAVLQNYRLAFSNYSSHRGGGVADIVKAKGEVVEGVLFEVPDFTRLDIREGAPYVYRRKKVRVYPANEHGRWNYAWTYEVVNKALLEYRPSRDYSLLIWDGAKVLSRSYRERLRENLLRKDRVIMSMTPAYRSGSLE